MDEVSGDQLFLGVSEVSFHRALSSGLDGVADGSVGGRLLESDGKIDDGGIDSRDTESHASEFTLDTRIDASDGLSGTSGGRNDVQGSGSSFSQLLLAGSVDGELGSGVGVDGGHEALDNSKVLVDDLNQRSEAVGGARSVGEDIDVRSVSLLVDAHNKHRGVSGRRRDDDLLGTTSDVSRGGGLLSEAASRLHYVVNAQRTPRDLSWVAPKTS